ncbi:MAG: hypothetical protein JNJ88_06255 [Planctomycetes bacterium]|nr:hypothetical protein [Planctomycetota bacterium]
MAEADQKNFAYDMKQNPPDNLTATSGTATASAIYSLTNTSTVLNWSLTVSSAIGVPPAGSYIHAHAKNKASIYVRVKNDGSRPGAFKIQWVGSAGLSISGAPSDGYAKGWLDANFFVTSFAQDGSGSKSASWDKERIHTVAANQELTFSLIGFALEIDLADQAPAIASARPEHSREGRLLQGSSASACILPRREEDLLLYRPRRRSSTAA